MTTLYAAESFIHQVLGKAISACASDIYLKVGKPPGARVGRDIVYFRSDKLRPEDTEAAAKVLLGTSDGLASIHEQVTSYSALVLGRFRVSLYRSQGALSIVLRAIPIAVPTLSELGVPAAATALIEQDRGLVIVAGGAASGRSSTLAAMIGYLNECCAKHIVTLEDPIEFVHEDRRACISAREIGTDTASFMTGLAAARTQNADVIFLSDLSDPDVLSGALDAVEAGALVLAAVGAADTGRAVARLLALGRGPDHPARVAAALAGVVAQRLLPKRDGSGVLLACELLVATSATREVIPRLAGESDLRKALYDLMEKGQTPHGMQTFALHQERLNADGLLGPPSSRG